MRWTIIVLMLIVGAGESHAQTREGETPATAIRYWENEPSSVVRDTTLIRLYSRAADRNTDLDSSLLWLQKGFKIAFRLRSSTWLAFVHNHIGLVYLRKGVSFQAIEYLFKGLQYAERAKDLGGQAVSWNYIGDCYANLKKYDKAVVAENRAIALCEASHDSAGQLQSLNDLGVAYRESNRLAASIRVLKKILDNTAMTPPPALRATALTNLAATYLKQDDFANAEKYALLAVEQETDTKGRADAELLSVLSLIASRSGQNVKSLDYAARAAFYIPYEWPGRREKVAYNLFLSYKALQMPDTALYWHEQFVSLRNRNGAEAQAKRIEVLRYEYDAQQRDQRMQAMADDMAGQAYLRNWLLLGILSFLVLALALWRSNNLLRRRREELDTTNLQLTEVGHLLQQTNATLEERVAERTEALRKANGVLIQKNNEIQEALFKGQSIERKRVAAELHDNLGSLLSGVKWRLESVDFDDLSEAKQEKYRSVVRLITDAYEQVRHIAHNLLPSSLQEKGFIPTLQKLVDELNRSGKGTFELICAPGVAVDDKKTAFELYSCALELINNALRHANARQVVIEIVQTEYFDVLMITDDGVGICSDQDKNQGLGLENIRHRVDSLRGNLSIRPFKGKRGLARRGTSITIRIPRQKVPA